MSRDGERNQANLTLMRVERTPREWLHLELAEAVAALPFPRGRRRSSRIARIAGRVRCPLEMPARLLDDVLDARIAGGGDMVVAAIHRSLKRYLARRMKRPVQHDSGEWKPAA